MFTGQAASSHPTALSRSAGDSTMSSLARWLAPAALAAALGAGALFPAPARADDDGMVRVIVNVADIAFRSGHPYYRHGS